MTCDNWRGTASLNVMYKVHIYTPHDRLVAYSEDIIGKYQSGFRKEEHQPTKFSSSAGAKHTKTGLIPNTYS